MRRNVWMQHAASAMVFVLACGVSAVGLLSARQSGQQPDQSEQQGQQPTKEKDKDKKKKAQGNSQDNAQGNPQDNAQPADNPNANAPAGPGAPASGKPAGGEKPAPLFGGSLNLKSSRQTKDTATMGFNGVDPNGQVQKSFLTAAVTNADRGKAQQVAAYKVDPQELAQFIQDAELNPNAARPPQKSN
jgi:hypothetical protein